MLLKTYDGATTDGKMNMDAIEFLCRKTDPEITTLVADYMQKSK